MLSGSLSTAQTGKTSRTCQNATRLAGDVSQFPRVSDETAGGRLPVLTLFTGTLPVILEMGRSLDYLARLTYWAISPRVANQTLFLDLM